MTARTPVIVQDEASECGLACLAMVLQHHGDRRSLAQLRQRGSDRGLTLERLIEQAEGLGLGTRALRIELEELKALEAPAILHWDLNHFVVLVSADLRGICIHDPARGRQRLSWREASSHFTGIALELWPSASFEPVLKAPQIHWRRLFGPQPGLFGTMARVLLLALVLETMLLASPFFMQGVIDHVLVGSDSDLLTVLAVAFAALLVLQALLVGLRSWSITALTSVLSLRWQSRLFRHLLRLPMAYFERRHLGDVLSRFESLQTVQQTLGGSFIEALMDGLMAVLTVSLMFAYSTTLGWVALLSQVGYLCLRLALFHCVRDGTERQIVAAARQHSHTVETLRGVQSLKLGGGGSSRLADWRNLLVGNLNESITLQRYGLAFRLSVNLLVGLERILVVWLGARLVLDQHFSVGMLVAFLAYRDQFANRATGLIDRFMEFRLLRVHAERISDITDSDAERSGGLPCSNAIESLRTEHLGFRYGDADPWILKDLNLQVRSGETVALVGPSGCGKSTLVKLLLGLLEPSTGQISVDGRALNRLNLDDYRSRCGSVMQDDQLFGGSIAENIAGFDATRDAERVRQVAAMAAIAADIEQMPMGYETRIGDLGMTLSGGQKQRVLLARALYRSPQILLLDEATSHLDVCNERLVNQTIGRLPMARLIIAHRPETIASADRVLVMEGGRIVREYRPDRLREFGNVEELPASSAGPELRISHPESHVA